MKREEILNNAKLCITQDRNNQYGEPEDVFSFVAAKWQVHIDNRPTGPLTAHDVAMMMIDLKTARSTSNPAHIDNYVDIAGYAACGGEIVSEKKTESLDLVIK